MIKFLTSGSVDLNTNISQKPNLWQVFAAGSKIIFNGLANFEFKQNGSMKFYKKKTHSKRDMIVHKFTKFEAEENDFILIAEEYQIMFDEEVSVDIRRTLEFLPNQETPGADNMSIISSGELELQESTIQDIPARGVLVLAKESKIQTTEPASIIFEDTCIVQYTHAEPTQVLLMNRIELDYKAIALEGSDDSDSLVEEQYVPNSVEWIQQTVENLTKKDKMQKLAVMGYPGIVKVSAKDTKSLLIIESGAILKNVIACSVKFEKSCAIVDHGVAVSEPAGA
jgi:hypothetical protein